MGAARQIREEVSSMEVDILVSENMTELLERTRPQMDSITHEVHMAILAATSRHFNNLGKFGALNRSRVIDIM